MARSVYSVRFLIASLQGVWMYYTVPAGKRAVIRSVTCVAATGVASQFYVSIAGAFVLHNQVPASEWSRFVDMRQVAYAGEDIGGVCGEQGSFLFVSGYLLDVPAGAQDEAPEASPGLPPPAYGERVEPIELLNRPPARELQ